MKTETKNNKTFYNSEVPRDWSSPEFGDVFNFLKTFSFSREQLTSETTIDEIRNIHYGDIHATYENEILDFEIEKTVPYLLDGIIDAKSFEDENFPALKEGDLIIADASEDYEGVCDCVELKNINGAKVVSGLHTFAARASEDKIALGYRTYALQHEQVIRELRRIATGTSVYGVSKTNLSKVKIPLPPLPEQKTIAQVLSTADAAIHTTEKLIAQKELRKKWLMQQLLTGKKRLKGFDGVWLILKIKNIGIVPEKKPITKVDNQKLLTVKLHTKGIEFNERDKPVISSTGRPYYERNEGEILIGRQNIHNGGIGLVTKEFDGHICSNAISSFKVNDNHSTAYFLFHLQYPSNYHRIEDYMGGTGQKELSEKQFLDIPIKLPKSKEEQTAIAQVLQAADKEISLLKAKADKFREQKKGLMQVLLTGKVRLNIDKAKLAQ
jgi:type I restriction enzyme S subunit